MSQDEEILAELRRIRELLTPTPPPPARPPPKGISQEFKLFFSEYKVLGLAVAFILGVYLGALVQAMVKDLILPIVALALGQNNVAFKVGPFDVGDFATALITFFIVVLIIFAIVKLGKRYKLD
ncbi:MAG: MscL family protein [Thaumarchaeota archaeon]|nr:MscL family protein [Nitrososphaerota archaeon]